MAKAKPTKKAPKRAAKAKPPATPHKANAARLNAQNGTVKATGKPRKGKPLPAPANATAVAPVPNKSRGANPPKAGAGTKRAAVADTSYPPAQPSPKVTRLWYVIACEPGTDRRVKKDIRRAKLIKGLEHKIGRAVCPHKVEEKLLTATATTIAEGECREAREARTAGEREAWKIAEGRTEYDMIPPVDPEGYKVVVHQSKGKEKGKVGNGWTWKVKKLQPAQKVVTGKTLKYPGYLIVNMHFDDESFHLIRKLRGVWGFLPLPIPTKSKPTIAEEKALQEWVPTALETEEAAEILIQQANENKKAKADKSPTLKFKVGDTVKVNNGAWVDADAVVRAITGSPTDPIVKVDVSFMGRVVPVTLNHLQVSVS